MRDSGWLKKQLDFLLKKYFSDVPLTNPIEIRFGREAKFRFGSIRLVKPRGLKLLKSLKSLRNRDPQKSIITITSMFAEESVPVDVVCYTIAHELCHYAHGFSSSNRRLFKYPHHGGIVNNELKNRGAQDLIIAFKKWLKGYRKKILSSKIIN
jgi:hypothetical protein